MVVYRQPDFVLSAVQWNFLMVFDILKNVDVFAADTFLDFGFELTIHKIGELCIDFEFGQTVFVYRPFYAGF